MPPRRRDDNGHSPEPFEDSPSGEHRRPLGSDEPWHPREKTDPHADARRGQWWLKPVTLPWGMLLAVGGVGAGGAGSTMLGNLLLPEDVVMAPELAAEISRIETDQRLRQQETDRKLDGISRDLTELHNDVDAMTAILDRAFPRFPTERRDP